MMNSSKTLKKAQVDRHLFSCKNCWGVTCVDCNFTFEGDSFRAVSYGSSGYMLNLLTATVRCNNCSRRYRVADIISLTVGSTVVSMGQQPTAQKGGHGFTRLMRKTGVVFVHLPSVPYISGQQ